MTHDRFLLALQSKADMNAFNRVFAIIMLAVLLVVGAVVLAVPSVLIQTLQSTADSLDKGFFAGFGSVASVIVRVILAIAWVLFMALLIWAEFRRPGSRTIEVARYTGGSAIRISTSAVADKVRDAVLGVGGIIDARVQATGRNRAVELKMDISATKDTDLVQKAEEIAAVTRQVVQDQLGLKLVGKPTVAIKPKQGKPVAMKPAKRNLPALPIDDTEMAEPPPALAPPSQTPIGSIDAPSEATDPDSSTSSQS